MKTTLAIITTALVFTALQPAQAGTQDTRVLRQIRDQLTLQTAQQKVIHNDLVQLCRATRVTLEACPYFGDAP